MSMKRIISTLALVLLTVIAFSQSAPITTTKLVATRQITIPTDTLTLLPKDSGSLAFKGDTLYKFVRVDNVFKWTILIAAGSVPTLDQVIESGSITDNNFGINKTSGGGLSVITVSNATSGVSGAASFAAVADGIGLQIRSNNSSVTGSAQDQPGQQSITATNSLYLKATDYRFYSGNVGINTGTTTPAYTLDINGKGRFSDTLFIPTLGTNANSTAAASTAWVKSLGYLSSIDTTNISNFYLKVRGLFSGTSPITYNSTTGAIGIQQANTSQGGYLSATDWNTFNNKQVQLNGTGFVKASGTTISYDNSTYVTTNTTQTISGEKTFTNDVTVTDHELSLESTDLDPSIPTLRLYKDATNFTLKNTSSVVAFENDGGLPFTFNNTVRFSTVGNGIAKITGGNGALTSGTIDTSDFANFYLKVRSLHSGTAPITYSTATGAIGITQATTSTNGYLSSTDWNTFNGKQTTLNGTGFVKASGTTISYDPFLNIKLPTSNNLSSSFFTVTDSVDVPLIEMRVNRSPVGSAYTYGDIYIGKGAGAYAISPISSTLTKSNYTFGDSTLAYASGSYLQNNLAIGNRSQIHRLRGGSNVSFGNFSLDDDSVGDRNTAIGFDAMQHVQAYATVGVGAEVFRVNLLSNGLKSSVINSVGIGFQAGGVTTDSTSRDSTVLVGVQAGWLGTGLKRSVLLGFQAGSGQTLGGNKLYIANSNTSFPLVYGEFNNDILATPGKFGIRTKTPLQALQVGGQILIDTITNGTAGTDSLLVTNNGLIKKIAANYYGTGSGSGITDGDKGDITVTSSGATWTIDNLAVTNAKINDVAWSKVTGTPTTISTYGITDGVTLTGTQTLTNKTLTAPKLNSSSTPNYVWTASGTNGAGDWQAVPTPDSSLFVTYSGLYNAFALLNDSIPLGRGLIANQIIDGLDTLYEIEVDSSGIETWMIADAAVTNAKLASGISLSKISITGTPNGSKFLRDDGSWQTVSGGGGGMAIGDAVTSGTSKSILYVDGSGNLAQDNSNFNWNFTDKTLGIGFNSQTADVEIRKQDVTLKLNSDDDSESYLRLTEADGTSSLIGGYVEYDGVNNEYIIGTHNNDDNNLGNDIPVIRIPRAGNLIKLAPYTTNSLLKTINNDGTVANAVSGTDYQAPITLTTTGTSGAATLIGNTLNIPQYTGGGGSYTDEEAQDAVGGILSSEFTYSDGTPSIALNIANIQAASGSQKGMLTSTDWSTFNNKQAGDADLTTIAGLTATTDNFIVSVSSAWASRTPSQVRTTLGLVIGTDVQAYDTDLTTYAGITPSSNVQTLLGASNYAAFKTSLSLDNVENTAISTWAGSTNITTLGTIGTGVWNGTKIAEVYGGTNQTTYTTGDILYASAANTLSKRTIGNTGDVLTVSGGVPTWVAPSAGSLTSSYVGYGNGSLTGEAAFTYSEATNKLTVDTVSTKKVLADTVSLTKLIHSTYILEYDSVLVVNSLIAKSSIRTMFNKAISTTITTNTTPTLLSLGTPDGSTITTYRITVHGYNQGNAECFSKQLLVTLKNSSGTISIIGSVQTVGAQQAETSLSSAAATVVISSNVPYVQVTGVAATTISWKAVFSRDMSAM